MGRRCFLSKQKHGLYMQVTSLISGHWYLLHHGLHSCLNDCQWVHTYPIPSATTKLNNVLGRLPQLYRFHVWNRMNHRSSNPPILLRSRSITSFASHGEQTANSEKKVARKILEDDGAIMALLKTCAQKKDLAKACSLHAEIQKRGFLERNLYLASALINLYAKCGLLAKAKQVLEDLPIRNVVSWNSLITGCAQQGQGLEALACFERMQQEGLSPDAITFTSVLKACGRIGAVKEGEAIHKEILNRGLLREDGVLGTALVDMYAKCGLLGKAQQVMEEIPNRNVFLWSALISGYVEQGRGYEALDCFERMQSEGFSPDMVTFVCILKACGKTGEVSKGEQIHGKILNKGLLEKDVVLGNALVDMYAKCGSLMKAKQVLEELPVRDIVSWNTLIAAYAQLGDGHQALCCFEKLQREGLCPDTVTFPSILKACGSIGALEKGRKIHLEIMNKDLLQKDIVIGNALVDMYAKCNMLPQAQQLLDRLPYRNIIAWNALISGYAEHGQGHEALKCFEQMRRDGVDPDAVIFSCLLKACASTGAISTGTEIHEEILNRGLLEKDLLLGTALVDMYAKVGLLGKAQDVLEKLPMRDVVCWSVLIAGYAQQGQGQGALKCFRRMQTEGFVPDEVTILCVLSACSHSGMMDEAQTLYRSMMRKYGISPNLEHHACMVMAFAYAGHFDQAMSIIKATPSSDRLPVWLVLLSACRKWGNVTLGRLAFDKATQLEKNCAAAYFLMVNIYAAAGMETDAEMIEAMRPKEIGSCAERNRFMY